MSSNNKFSCWEETIPHFKQSALLSPVMHVNVSVGSPVVIRHAQDEWSTNRDDIIVGTIVSYVSESEIVCSTYELIDEVDCMASTPRIPFGVGYGMKEVVKTTGRIVVNIHDIVDFAFIFKYDNIEDDFVEYGGINNCFLIRYQLDEGVYEDIKGYLKFPCDSSSHPFYNRSSIATIWHGITNIQETLWKVLNSESERQVTVVRVPLNVDFILLQYLLYRCSGVIGKVTVKETGVVRCVTMRGMKRVTKKSKRNVFFLRFETEQHIALFHSMIGDSSTIGIRRRRPKLGCFDKLAENNAINVILPKSQVITTKRYVYHDSIDIVSDECNSFMMVRYGSYMYNGTRLENERSDIINNDYIMKMFSCNEMNRTKKIQGGIRVGQILSRGTNIVAEVKSVTESAAVLIYLEPEELEGHEEIEDDLELLCRQIKEFNSIS